MVWEEIKRILTGVEEEASPGKKYRSSSPDEEIGEELTYAPAEVARLPGAVTIEPFPVQQGEAFTVQYEGLLAQQGAVGITLHCGYGREAWSHIRDIPMHPAGYGKWQATVFSDRSGPFNFCFRDTAGHWDNNSGQNWSIDIHPA